MRTLVTGASGFIGTHLVRHLIKCTGELISTVGRSKGPGVTRHFQCDLTDFGNLRDLLKEFQPDIVYHLAGTSRPDPTISFPGFFEGNDLTTRNLLEAMESYDTPVTFFLASSVHVYGSGDGDYVETSPVSPRSDHAFSKYLAEEAVRRQVEKRPRLRAVIGRFADCSGPGQRHGYPLPDLCRGLSPETPLVPERLPPLRGFIDVRDLVSVSQKLVAARPAERLEVFNLASPHPMGGARFDITKVVSRLSPLFRPLEQSLKDFREWYTHPRP